VRSAVRACAVAEATAVSTAEVAKLFGRLAEPMLYLDETVGPCCHSACSDCEWRDPEGGYRFDLMKATQPKWVPCYLLRDFADQRGSHTTRWSAAIFGADESVSRDAFGERLSAMEFATSMGPKGMIRPPDDVPSAEAVDAFWQYLVEGSDSSELSVGTMRARLQDMSLEENRDGAIGEGPDSVVWKGFALALGVKPFDRW